MASSQYLLANCQISGDVMLSGTIRFACEPDCDVEAPLPRRIHRPTRGSSLVAATLFCWNPTFGRRKLPWPPALVFRN